ncbi:MAG: response regulator transcription factor [Pseudomonadota bacterium]|nr:response regulator transcription factor [Pseudomonadota bacterium]
MIVLRNHPPQAIRGAGAVPARAPMRAAADAPSGGAASGPAADGAPGRGVAFARALIVDDHPLFCEALTLMLREMGVADIAAADRLSAAVEHLDRAGAPDIVLLDLSLPDVNGLDGLIRLKRMVGATPIVVISSMEEHRIVASVLRAGASGFVPKQSPRDAFARAFAAIRAGGVFRPDGFVAVEGDGPDGEAEDAIDRLALLTPQQARILEAVCEGKLNKQIAHDLDIAETTVKAHITAILRKLGVHSRTQAVLIAQNARYRNILRDASGVS